MIVYYIVVIVGGVFDYRLLSISVGLDFAAIISYIILNVDGPIDPVATLFCIRSMKLFFMSILQKISFL